MIGILGFRWTKIFLLWCFQIPFGPSRYWIELSICDNLKHQKRCSEVLFFLECTWIVQWHVRAISTSGHWQWLFRLALAAYHQAYCSDKHYKLAVMSSPYEGSITLPLITASLCTSTGSHYSHWMPWAIQPIKKRTLQEKKYFQTHSKKVLPINMLECLFRSTMFL